MDRSNISLLMVVFMFSLLFLYCQLNRYGCTVTKIKKVIPIILYYSQHTPHIPQPNMNIGIPIGTHMGTHSHGIVASAFSRK